MPRVRRNNSPADSDLFCFTRNNRSDGGGRARLHGVLAPPRVSFGEPEGVESRSVAGLRHANRFLQRLHAELQHTDFERHAHRFGSSPFINLEASLAVPKPDRSRNVPNLLRAARARDLTA